MLIIEKDLTVHITRGDAGAINVSAKDEDTGEVFKFLPGDIVRFTVHERKDCNCVVLTKDTEVTEETEVVTNKPVKYSYEVEVNPDTAPNTIICHDLEGPKAFIVYPEGGRPK